MMIRSINYSADQEKKIKDERDHPELLDLKIQKTILEVPHEG